MTSKEIRFQPLQIRLRMSSAVKFAKYIPPKNDSEECLSQTREMIKKINNHQNMKTENAG